MSENNSVQNQPNDSSVTPNEKDPLQELLGLVGDGKNVKDVKDLKIKKKVVIDDKPKLSNQFMLYYYNYLKKKNYEPEKAVMMVFKLDELIESGEVSYEDLKKKMEESR